MSETELTIGEKLEDLRKGKNLTLKEVGEKAMLSPTTISNYENEASSPTIDKLKALLEVYGTTLLEFWGVSKSEVENDWATFKRYGLNQAFFIELLISRHLKRKGDTASCLNKMFQNPVYATYLFEALAHYFDPACHEQVNGLSAPLPAEASKRALLEPVIQTLGRIYDSLHPDTAETEASPAVYHSTAEEQREFQHALLKLSQDLLGEDEA